MTPSPPIHDSVALLRQALVQMDTLVQAISPESLHAPTPCPDFDVTALLDHLGMIADRVTAAAGGDTAKEFTRGAKSATPSQVAQWQARLVRVTAAMDGCDLTAIVELPFGTMPLSAAFGVFVGEFTTHAWDLAAAIGRQDLLDDDLGAAALAMVTVRVPASPREDTPFADVVAVPDSASVHDQLAGWMGRDPVAWVQ
ncbi:MAG: TIGR03086 family metal-binding protein [Propionibacteriales bacterium]|nr:TIGR03086 family metal-binding protein [Propionibacteriales bacterium]